MGRAIPRATCSINRRMGPERLNRFTMACIFASMPLQVSLRWWKIERDGFCRNGLGAAGSPSERDAAAPKPLRQKPSRPLFHHPNDTWSGIEAAMQAMVKRFRRSGPMRRLMLQVTLGIALPMALWPLKLIYRQPQTVR